MEDAFNMCVLCFQGQACMMVLRMVQNRDVQQLLAGQPWLELCVKLVEQLVAVRRRNNTPPHHSLTPRLS